MEQRQRERQVREPIRSSFQLINSVLRRNHALTTLLDDRTAISIARAGRANSLMLGGQFTLGTEPILFHAAVSVTARNPVRMRQLGDFFVGGLNLG